MAGWRRPKPRASTRSFRVAGPTFEEMWTHYARLCGVKQPYAEKTFLVSADTGPNGTYVVSDRPAAADTVARGVSVFLLTTDAYTATVSFHPAPDCKAILGSVAVAVK